jgi:hypothetical protein
MIVGPKHLYCDCLKAPQDRPAWRVRAFRRWALVLIRGSFGKVADRWQKLEIERTPLL